MISDQLKKVILRELSLDDGYMFTVEDTVRNDGDTEATLRPYGLVSRAGLPSVSGDAVAFTAPRLETLLMLALDHR